ncbi:hypothetical protein EV356DRAFT_555920 [Viridothelium virens]|uniref:Uncharacterized protein n=1 Tax=Viridothelium virens TaxID=1048519 RepID=A0A6A6GUR9_VIRVR|nr:hypothetical protein EV356DRAFT_555920 [Viridothelium virens]
MIGFFSLPFELREMIYEHALPADGFITVANPFPFPEEQHIRNMALTNMQVREELYQVITRKYGFRIVIQPTFVVNYPEPRLDLGHLACLRLDRAKSIELYMDYNVDDLDPTSYRRQGVNRCHITGLEKQLAKVVTIMETFSKLPSLKIRFRDEPRPSTGAISFGDPFWTQSCDNCDDRPCTVMRNFAYLPAFATTVETLTCRPDLIAKFRSIQIIPLRCICAQRESENWGLDPFDNSLERPVKTSYDNVDRSELIHDLSSFMDEEWGHRKGLFPMWLRIKWTENDLQDPNFL